MKEDLKRFLPLAPATLHILLALAGEDLHGYGIMQEVSRQSEGRYKLGPGTLYDNLQRLLEQGLVEEVGSVREEARRYYRLNSLGRSVLAAEIGRLEGVVRDGRLRLQAGKPRKDYDWRCPHSTRRTVVSAFQDRCLQPLGHPSHNGFIRDN